MISIYGQSKFEFFISFQKYNTLLGTTWQKMPPLNPNPTATGSCYTAVAYSTLVLTVSMCSLLFANFGVATGVKCTLHNGVFIAEVLMIRKK
jgi:hypothetical protein